MLAAVMLLACSIGATAHGSAAAALPPDSTAKPSIKHSVHLRDVVVTAKHTDFGIRSAQMSALSITPEQVTMLPPLLGEVDLLKVLQRMPGVQSAGDGTSAIYVRGGDYDQNLILLDGTPLFNAEHLNGYTSAINADVVKWMDFYRGAFPVRYGSRLSSVIDVGLRSGDFNHYHGLLSVGVLSSRLQAEGPIWAGHTSFNLAARFSYFDLMAKPVLKKVYDNPDALSPFSNLNYYDVTAKITHRLAAGQEINAVAYYGKDRYDISPRKSSGGGNASAMGDAITTMATEQSTTNHWSNLITNLAWTKKWGKVKTLTIGANYSNFSYLLNNKGNEKYNVSNAVRLLNASDVTSSTAQHSDVSDLSLKADVIIKIGTKHAIRFGVKATHQMFDPRIHITDDQWLKTFSGTNEQMPIQPNDDDFYKVLTTHLDTIISSADRHYEEVAAYAEDDYDITSWLRLNYGLRLAAYVTRGKTYFSPEPRISLRLLFAGKHAIKLSYSHMAQGIHRLSTSNITSPSDLWVPITKDLPLVKSDQEAIGYSCEFGHGLTAGIEAYYKTQSNLLEYREGASFMSGSSDWRDLVSLGKGRSWGFEVYAEKEIGDFKGWLSYTWSKSKRKFDRPGQEINNGKEYYALNDRRHNFSVTLQRHFTLGANKSVDLSVGWTYVTGRRGTLPEYSFYGSIPRNFDNFETIVDALNKEDHLGGRYHRGDYGAFYSQYFQFYTFMERNGFRLPATHHLDLGANFNFVHSWGQSIIGLSIYNVYNHKNVANVFMGVHGIYAQLKGVCPFPIMPSVSYTLKF